jgi:hypothetical protein
VHGGSSAPAGQWSKGYHIIHSVESIGEINDIYTTVISTLIILQDSSLIEDSLLKVVPNLQWYREKPNAKVSDVSLSL